MGLFDLFKKRAKKPQSETPAFQYEPSHNRKPLQSDKEIPNNFFQTDTDETEGLSEEGHNDTKSLSTSISSESAYENVKINPEERMQPPEQMMPTRFCEKDNLGIRIRSMIEESAQQSKSEPFEEKAQQQFQPYLRYLFASGEDARDALLGLNFIHEAEDTGNLICTEPLTFGCYRLESGKYEAYIGGWQLTPRLWQAAKDNFAAHHGRIKNEQRPDTDFSLKSERGLTLSERVTKIREYSQLNSGQTEFYSIYEAPNGVIAQAFLKQKQNIVTKPDWYIVVKTPDGDFWRDIGGIYKKMNL